MIVSGIAHGIYWNLYDHKLHNHSQVYHKHPVLFQSIDYLSAIFVKVFVHLRHSSLQAASAAAACSEFMRISRGLLPMFGPTMLRSSISSMRRAARV